MRRSLMLGLVQCDASDGAKDGLLTSPDFMMPGMNHCRGGAGPDTFDRMGVIERWVEQGQVPTRIDAEHRTKGVVDRTRPLCAYPEVATYQGAGSLDEAASFVCKAP